MSSPPWRTASWAVWMSLPVIHDMTAYRDAREGANSKSTIAPIDEATLVSEDLDESVDPATLVIGTGTLPASIAVGAIDPAGMVPVLNGVPGSGVPNSDVSIPLTVLTHGTSYCYTVSIEDNNVTGDYEVDYYIRQVVGGVAKTIVDKMIVKARTTAPGGMWVSGRSTAKRCRTRPESPR